MISTNVSMILYNEILHMISTNVSMILYNEIM